jgi:hypothetical protein
MLTHHRRLQPGTVTILDSVESVLTEVDNGSNKNVEYAIAANEGDTDTQWTFTELKEFGGNIGGIDLIDTLTFESLDEDGGYRHFRVKGEFVDIDTGIIAGEAEVDLVTVGIYVNGVLVDQSETGDPAEAAAAVNFDTIISVQDGDNVQFPLIGNSSKDEEVDVTFEVDEAAIIIT